MLFPAPSLRAAAELEKYAYNVRFRPGFEIQVVVAVTPLLPALLADPEVNAKLTELLLRFTEIDSESVALSAIDCTPELITCAFADVASNTITIVQRPNLTVSFTIDPSRLLHSKGAGPTCALCSPARR